MAKKIHFFALASLVACILCLISFTACGNDGKQAENSTISTLSPSERTAEGDASKTATAATEASAAVDKTEKAPTGEAAARAVQGTINSKAEIVRIYTEAYNKTKAARSLAGSDAISILPGTFSLNGSASATVEKLINKNVNKIFSQSATLELPPSGKSYQTCILREEDVKAASLKEAGNTVTLKIVPRDNGIPVRGKGGSGNFTEVVSMDAIQELVQAKGVTFTNGQSFDDCVTLEFLGTESTIQIDKISGLITSAEYQSLFYVKAEHVNVAWFQNQSASATICYRMQYAAAK